MGRNNPQMYNYKALLLKILITIEYEEDKEKFIEEFIQSIQPQSIVDLLQSLPSDKQAEIMQQLSKNANNPEQFNTIIKKCFSEEELEKALEKASRETTTQYIQAIKPSLSPTQEENLVKVINELESTHAK